eukprot:3304808-Pyramimonas_sp.AAC.1
MLVRGCWAAYPRQQNDGLLEACKHDGQGQLARTPTAIEENRGAKATDPKGTARGGTMERQCRAMAGAEAMPNNAKQCQAMGNAKKAEPKWLTLRASPPARPETMRCPGNGSGGAYKRTSGLRSSRTRKGGMTEEE